MDVMKIFQAGSMSASVVFGSANLGAVETTATNVGEFCAEAQRLVAATAMTPANYVYADLDAFIKSKASSKPFITRQYVHHEPDDPNRPRMISCKLKSSDQLNFEYGPGTAGHEGHCRAVNGLTLERARAARADAARPSGVFDDVVLDHDETGLSGVVWLKPYTMVKVDEANVLHIKSKALYVSWHDQRFVQAPARFRGTHYCHLIAPSYLRRLLDGEVAVPGPDV